MTDSYILEKMFRTLTSLKFETLFLSSDCLLVGERGDRCNFCIFRENVFRNAVINSIRQGLRNYFIF